MLIDTHKVTPDNGMVCTISSASESLQAMCDEMAALIEKRLLYSLKEAIYSEYGHEINVISRMPLKDSELDSLGLFNLDKLLKQSAEEYENANLKSMLEVEVHENAEAIVINQCEIGSLPCTPNLGIIESGPRQECVELEAEIQQDLEISGMYFSISPI